MRYILARSPLPLRHHPKRCGESNEFLKGDATTFRPHAHLSERAPGLGAAIFCTCENTAFQTNRAQTVGRAGASPLGSHSGQELGQVGWLLLWLRSGADLELRALLLFLPHARCRCGLPCRFSALPTFAKMMIAPVRNTRRKEGRGKVVKWLVVRR